MEISRTTNGETHTYELTETELYRAYLEQEHRFDKADILDMVIDLEDEEVLFHYGVHKEEFFALADQMSAELRGFIDGYGMDLQQAKDAAATKVIKKYLGEGKSLYKIVHKEELVGWYYVGANSEEEALTKFGLMCNNGEIDFSDMEVSEFTDEVIEIEPALQEDHSK